MFYFSVLAYKLSAEITQMPWLKKSSSVCILILNGNSCTSLVFQIWRYMFLLSLWQVFCIPLFLEYLMILFFHLLSFVLIRPSLGLQMALSLDFLSLALFLEFISAPIPFPPTPPPHPSVVFFFSENLCLGFPCPHFHNICSFPLLADVGQHCCR